MITSFVTGFARRRLGTALLTGVAATAAAAGIASAASAAAPPSAPTAASRAATTAATTAAPAFRPRTQVPWHQVGSGWQVATWVGAHATRNTRATVVLISPSGTRYAVTKVPNNSFIESWSPDGHTLLVEAGRQIEVNLPTGHRATFRPHVPGAASAVVLGFTADSRGVLVEAADNKFTEWTARVSLAGQFEHSYPVRVSGAGLLDESMLPLPGGGSATGARHGVVVFGPRGHVVRRLAPHLTGCTVSSLWSKDVALARCNRGALWTIPLSGAPVRRITDSVSKENPWGYDTAWRYSSGRLGLAGNSCGPDSLVRFTPAGHGVRFVPPLPVRGDQYGVAAYIGHHGDIVDMVYVRGCTTVNATLFAYNAASNTSTALLGSGAGGGTALSWEAWPGDR